ncbi:MAG TPA: hypothetical protein VHO91_13745 [Rhodopila sp.]|nr:hypothetical protein [Rhodopila sp.]
MLLDVANELDAEADMMEAEAKVKPARRQATEGTEREGTSALLTAISRS